MSLNRALRLAFAAHHRGEPCPVDALFVLNERGISHPDL